MKTLSAGSEGYCEWNEKFKNLMGQVRPGPRRILEQLEHMVGKHMADGLFGGRGDVLQMPEITVAITEARRRRERSCCILV